MSLNEHEEVRPAWVSQTMARLNKLPTRGVRGNDLYRTARSLLHAIEADDIPVPSVALRKDSNGDDAIGLHWEEEGYYLLVLVTGPGVYSILRHSPTTHVVDDNVRTWEPMRMAIEWMFAGEVFTATKRTMMDLATVR